MKEKGIEPARLKMAAVCSVCAEPFVNYMREFADCTDRLGPVPVPGRLSRRTRQRESRTEVDTTKKTIIVFSGDFDKVMAAFIIANGAAAMGDEVTMFFTFWGLNALRKDGVTGNRKGKSTVQKMFATMMPARRPAKLVCRR